QQGCRNPNGQQTESGCCRRRERVIARGPSDAAGAAAHVRQAVFDVVAQEVDDLLARASIVAESAAAASLHIPSQHRYVILQAVDLALDFVLYVVTQAGNRYHAPTPLRLPR